MNTTPITVSIERTVDPERIAQATAWMQTGINLATTYPGFLGSGWVRAGTDSTTWHMLYRFADDAALLHMGTIARTCVVAAERQPVHEPAPQ